MTFGTIKTYDEATGWGNVVLEDGATLPFLNDRNKVALIVGQHVSCDFVTIAINLWPTDGTEPRIMVGSDGKRV
ncbi:MAG: hypothetical protein WB680_23210 [Candidatus Acidiferrales bacterium]